MRNIILCGFMGSGKSTIGRALSDKLRMKLIDTDAYIEEKEGMTVSEIFAQHGEEYFRAAETKACEELSTVGGCVISTGGGTLLNEKNAELLKKNGMIFLLDISPRMVLIRLRGDTTRPLLQVKDKRAAVEELMEKRMPLYRKAADYVVDAEGSPRKICAEIVAAYNNGGKYGR